MLAPNAPLGIITSLFASLLLLFGGGMSSVASMPGFRLMLPYRGPMQDMQRLAPEVRPAFWFRRAVLATEAQADPGGDGCLAPDIKPCGSAVTAMSRCMFRRPSPPTRATAIPGRAHRHPSSKPPDRFAAIASMARPVCATAHHGCGHNMLDF